MSVAAASRREMHIANEAKYSCRGATWPDLFLSVEVEVVYSSTSQKRSFSKFEVRRLIHYLDESVR